MNESKTRPSKEELERLYLEERLNAEEIKEILSMSESTVYRLLRGYGIPRRSRSEANSLAHLPKGVMKPSKEELDGMYLEEKLSTTTIAEIIGVTASTASRWLRGYGIPARNRQETKSLSQLRKGVKKPSKEDLQKLYLDERMNTVEIGKKIGVADSTVGNWLREYGIKIRTLSEAKLPKGVKKLSKEELEGMYLEERLSAIEIAKKRRVSGRSVFLWLKEYKIPIRSLSESHLAKGILIPSKEELERMYVTEGLSRKKIAEKLSTTTTAVGSWLKKYQIPIRTYQDSIGILERILGDKK